MHTCDKNVRKLPNMSEPSTFLRLVQVSSRFFGVGVGCGDDLPKLPVATAEQGMVLSPGNTHPYYILYFRCPGCFRPIS